MTNGAAGTGLQASDSLAALTSQARADIERIAHPRMPWLEPRIGPDGKPALDVLIVGGGQSGVAVAFGLARARVTNVLVIDKAVRGREGPWRTYARMPTLRSPKDYTGPDLDIPSLTYQSWHEAKFGAESWETLGNIPRDLWADYLLWVRDVTATPVRNETTLVDIAPAAGLLAATVQRSDGNTEILHARKILLATGQDGMGLWWMPPLIAGLPARASRPLRRRDRFRLPAGQDRWRSSAPAPRPWTMPPWRWSTAPAKCSCSAGATPSRSCSPTAGLRFADFSPTWATSTMPGAGGSCPACSACARAFLRRPTIAAPGTPASASSRAPLSTMPEFATAASRSARRRARSPPTSSSAAPA